RKDGRVDDVARIATGAIAGFALTFAPLVLIWGWTSVWETNPFRTQGAFAPPWAVIGVVVLASGCGWIARNPLEIHFWSGIWIVVIVCVYLLRVALQSSFVEMFLGSRGDITYLLFAV